MIDLSSRLKELARTFAVPGASLAILQDGELEVAVAGVVNRNTKVRTTPDSIFEIGSITKVYTATLVMQLVDDASVDLDATVRTYLPKFQLRDESAAAQITVRQLLTHTSGIDGDYFADFGCGDDCVERYVDSLVDIDAVFPPGTMWSYSNAAFVVAGRIVEVVTGLPWHVALRERLLEPAGLNDHVTLPEEAIFYRAAVGHIRQGKAKRPTVARPWQLARSTGPCGATLCATAADVARFGRLHLNNGKAADDSQVLSAASAEAMRAEQASVPGADYGAMGLGWITERWPTRVAWHNGGTIGQYSYLYVIPDHNFTMCVLTNADGGPPLVDAISKEILAERFGIARPDGPQLPDEPVLLDLAKYAGRYERASTCIDVEPDDGKLKVTMKFSIPGVHEGEAQVFAVTALDRESFGMVDKEGKVQGTIAFLGFDADERPGYIYVGRVARRVG